MIIITIMVWHYVEAGGQLLRSSHRAGSYGPHIHSGCHHHYSHHDHHLHCHMLGGKKLKKTLYHDHDHHLYAQLTELISSFSSTFQIRTDLTFTSGGIHIRGELTSKLAIKGYKSANIHMATVLVLTMLLLLLLMMLLLLLMMMISIIDDQNQVKFRNNYTASLTILVKFDQSSHPGFTPRFESWWDHINTMMMNITIMIMLLQQTGTIAGHKRRWSRERWQSWWRGRRQRQDGLVGNN